MKKIKLTVSAFTELCAYVKMCFDTEFFFVSDTLGKLIECHLQEIYEKLHRKALDVSYKQQTVVRLNFTRAELISLSYVFAAVPCVGYMLTIQHKLLEGL